jgi:hypothetical protein
MDFDVTRLDNITLLQTLYLHADPVGRGIGTYTEMLQKGHIVEGLPKEECEKLLMQGGSIDYYNGKPLKLLFSHLKTGQIVLSSHPYDNYHGRYRFLEALLAVFDLEEIILLDNEDNRPIKEEETSRRTEVIAAIEELLQHLTPFASEYGNSYKIDSTKVAYKSAYLRELGL